MGTKTQACVQDDLELASGIFDRVATDLSMILDREIEVRDVRAGRETQRAGGEGCVHISFKLGFRCGERASQGCLLVPLPDALTLAAYMMMLPDALVAEERKRTELDGPFKEALLEVGKFLAGACDTVLRRVLVQEASSRSEGCQGVRPGVRPAFSYREGDELIVARAEMRIHDFPPCQLILMFPELSAES